MALITYFTRAPRYKDITANDILLIESYLSWQHENEIGSRYSCSTFKEWCGIPDEKLPNKETIDFYKQFYTKKKMWIEGIGKQNCYSIFEQLVRHVKTNQIFNWFIKNTMNDSPDTEYHEVTKEQLERLLHDCNKVKDTFTFLHWDDYMKMNRYAVNEDVAKEYLPLLENGGYFFGSKVYDEYYADQVIDVIQVVENILKTTDFEKETIYFNAIW